ncbi:MAG: TIGR02556 family CRISPR-associated protein [Methanobrevibacter sp.]|uniref:TIGR02556 family CRISPR-associated protein n=1 Tax=Methanobrevibacter sp. TaxID=66852 RepID=UPI003F10B0CD
MLKAIYNLGKLWIEAENLDKINILLDSGKLNKNTRDVIVINLIKSSDGSFEYNRVYHESFDPEKNVKYLYKKGSSRGTDITPSCLLTDPKKTFNNKFLKWFNNNKEKNEMYRKINDLLDSNKEQIFNDLVELHESLEIRKTNTLLTLVISKNDQNYYIGDFNCFKEILLDSANEKFYKSGSKKVKGNGTCFLCDEPKEVYGLVSNAIGFSFSTPEKVGNVPGITLENQWKLVPICNECALYLQAGKKFVERYLNFSEFGLTYYVIPNFLFDNKKGFDILYRLLKSNELSEKNQNSENIVEIEDKLNILVKNLNDLVEFKFLFYEASNNAFNILAYVESVIPSWLNRLYDVQENISDSKFFCEENMKPILGDKTEGNFIQIINSNSKFNKIKSNKWYWRFIKDFTSSFSNKVYLDLVAKIINQRKIDYSFLLSKIMNQLRSNWRNEERYAININILKSLMLLNLLNQLDLIKGEKIMNEKAEFDLESMLNTPAKYACFLLGALTRRLLNVQYKELNSTPFYNKLWGLSLDQKKIKKLYPMVINKLREYDKAYLEMEEDISKYLMAAENKWGLKKDETSYFFVLGFTLPYIINQNKQKEDDSNE